jgi:hypothetical protein
MPSAPTNSTWINRSGNVRECRAEGVAGLVVFRHPGLEHYQRLIEAARSLLADLELDDGVAKSKVDSVRSKLFGALRLQGEHTRPRVWILAPSLKSCVESRGRPEMSREPSMPRGRDMEHARARVLPSGRRWRKENWTGAPG